MRGDLRLSTEFRPITIETNLISCKDGSSCVIYGKTKIISSILGPKQSKYSKFEIFNHLSVDVDVDFAYKNSMDNLTSTTVNTATSAANITTQGYSNNNNDNLMKKKYSKFIKDSIFPCVDIYKFPRMLLSIHVLIINDDGSSLPIAVNASILALLDAGIPMLYYIQSISIILLSSYKDNNNDHNNDMNNHDNNNEHQLIVDPCSEEERQCKAMFTFSIVCNDDNNNVDNNKNDHYGTKILLNESIGRFDHEVLIDAAKLALDSIQTLSKLTREAITSNLK